MAISRSGERSNDVATFPEALAHGRLFVGPGERVGHRHREYGCSIVDRPSLRDGRAAGPMMADSPSPVGIRSDVAPGYNPIDGACPPAGV